MKLTVKREAWCWIVQYPNGQYYVRRSGDEVRSTPYWTEATKFNSNIVAESVADTIGGKIIRIEMIYKG